MKKILVVLSILVSASAAHAQVLYGTIVGNVTDASAATIPGAQVKAANAGRVRNGRRRRRPRARSRSPRCRRASTR